MTAKQQFIERTAARMIESGRAYAPGITPSAFHAGLKDGLPSALSGLLDQIGCRDGLIPTIEPTITDDTIGQALVDEWRKPENGNLYVNDRPSSDYAPLGQWLREQYQEWQREDLADRPDWLPSPTVRMTSMYPATLKLGDRWVTDGEHDIPEGVDALMRRYGWAVTLGSLTGGKDYLSGLIGAKARRLYPVGSTCRVVADDQLITGTGIPLSAVRTGSKVTIERHGATDYSSPDYLCGIKGEDSTAVWTIQYSALGPVGDDVVDGMPVVEEQPADTRTEHEIEVARLNEALDLARTRHQHDIDLIGETLMQEATDRSWCSEYDQIVEGLNAHLHRELPVRTVQHDGTAYITVTATQTIAIGVTAEVEGGGDVDDALSEAADDIDEDTIAGYLSGGDWTITDYEVDSVDQD